MNEVSASSGNSYFMISEGRLSAKQIVKYEELRAKFIIADPTEELKQIYEVNRLADLIGLRAEKFDSPEHQYLLKTDQKSSISGSAKPTVAGKPIPRTVQNPNFDQLVNLLKQLRGTPILRNLKRLVEFLTELSLPRLQAELAADPDCLHKLIKLPTEQRANFDVRFCFKTSEAINYLYNHYVVGME